MSVPPSGRVALGLCLAALAGCAALPAAPPAHYILVHKEGDPIDREKKKLTPEQFKSQYVDRILAGIERHVAKPTDDKPTRIMLFVHGGLNTYEAGLKRVNDLVRLEDDPEAPDAPWGRLLGTPYYPIFVNWNSSLWSSLWDDIFIVRRGRRAPLQATATAPFVLLSRVAEAGLSIPRTLWSFVEPEGRPEGSDAGERPPDKGPSYLLLAPVRGVTVPFLDAFGTGAWDIMKRRAAFVTARGLPAEAVADLEPRMPKRPARDEQRQGAGRTLVQSLVGRLCVKDGDASRLFWTEDADPEPATAPRRCKDGQAGREVQLTLVGHSMGALVVNRVLLGFPNVPFHRVVLLAAAASIDDLDTAVLPYLDRHPETEFHNVSLSMNDERYERGWGDLWERGSLLVWIDNLFERVNAPQQLRLGRCLNLFRPAPDEPRSTSARYAPRVFFHKLTGQATDDPRRHGDFDEPLKLPRILEMVDDPAARQTCMKPAAADSSGAGRSAIVGPEAKGGPGSWP